VIHNCPKCQAPYTIGDQNVGRTFTCQRCQTPLLVQPDGLQIAGASGPVVPPSTSSANPVSQGSGAYGASQDFGDDEDDYEEDDFHRRMRRTGKPGKVTLMDYVLFRRMIVPIIVQILFWLAVLFCFIASAVMFAMGITNMNRPESLGFILMSPIVLIFGPLFARIYAELIIVTFSINETLVDIHHELRTKDPNRGP
jgi:hypothetical protein